MARNFAKTGLRNMEAFNQPVSWPPKHASKLLTRSPRVSERDSADFFEPRAVLSDVLQQAQK